MSTGVDETIDLESLEAESIPLHEGGVRMDGGPDTIGIEFAIDDEGDLEIRAFSILSRNGEDLEIVSTFNVLNLNSPQSVLDALRDVR